MKDIDILLSPDEIQRRIREIGKQLSNDYRNKNPLFVAILRGAFIFASDLARVIDIPCTFDFMAVSSYGSATKTSGVVRILKDLDDPIRGRHVVIVEDIVDTGLTINYLRKFLVSRSPASVRICCLLDKKDSRMVEAEVDYAGFSIPNHFVVGFGLDYDQHYRNLPFVGYFTQPPEETREHE